jgi:hypothetical protein
MMLHPSTGFHVFSVHSILELVAMVFLFSLAPPSGRYRVLPFKFRAVPQGSTLCSGLSSPGCRTATCRFSRSRQALIVGKPLKPMEREWRSWWDCRLGATSLRGGVDPDFNAKREPGRDKSRSAKAAFHLLPTQCLRYPESFFAPRTRHYVYHHVLLGFEDKGTGLYPGSYRPFSRRCRSPVPRDLYLSLFALLLALALLGLDAAPGLVQKLHRLRDLLLRDGVARLLLAVRPREGAA